MAKTGPMAQRHAAPTEQVFSQAGQICLFAAFEGRGIRYPAFQQESADMAAA